MKRTFGKNLVLFILIVLFTLCMAVGCTTLNISPVADSDDQETQPAINTESSITMELAKAHVQAGETIDLTITVKMKNDDKADRKWGSADFYITSNYSQYLTLLTDDSFNNSNNDKKYNVSGKFADSAYYTSNIIETKTDGRGFLHFTMAGRNQNNSISASEDLVINLKLQVADRDKFTQTTGDFTFGINAESYNVIAAWGADGSNDNKGEQFSANDNLTVTATKAEIRPVSGDTSISLLQVIENGGTPTEIITADPKDDAENKNKNLTYTAELASKDNFVIKAVSTQLGAKITFTVNGQNSETVQHENTYKVPLNGGNNGDTRITITVQPEAEDGSPYIYYLTVTQIYSGLKSLEVTTNESASVTTKGLSKDTPVEDTRTQYDIYVPYSAGVNTSATRVTIKPTIVDGYGMSSTINLTSATNCTVNSSNVTSGGEFTIDADKINDNASFVMQLINSKGATKAITVNLIKVSVDTSIKDFSLTGKNDNSDIQSVDKTGVDYSFSLGKDTGYSASINLQTTDSGATFVLKQNGVAVEAVDDKYFVEPGQYTLTVTAAAGNTQDYVINIDKEVIIGAIVKFEYTTAEGDIWTGVFGTDAPADPQYKYDADTRTFELEVPISLENMRFKFSITDESEISASALTNKTANGTDNKDYKSYIYSFNDLKIGVNSAEVIVSSKAGNNSYKINIIKTEADYDITDIKFVDKEDNNMFDIDTFDFDAETLTYSITVPFATSSVKFNITANGVSTIVNANGSKLERTAGDGTSTHTGSMELRNAAVTELKITYAGTDGIKTEGTKTYTILFTRQAASSDDTLKSLKVTYNDNNVAIFDGDNGSTAFDPNVTTYNITLPTDTQVEKVTIIAEANSKYATVIGDGEFIITQTFTSTKSFSVRVIPENAKNNIGGRTYTINISITPPTFDNDNKLYNLEIIGSDGVNYINYSYETKTYSITVPYSVNAFRVNTKIALPSKVDITYDNNSADMYNENGLYILTVGSNNKLTIIVTSEGGTKGEAYTITITRSNALTNANLSSLSATGTINLLNGIFDTNTYYYEVTANNNPAFNNIDIVADAADRQANITILKDNEIVSEKKFGTNKAKVQIAHGTTATYVIRVNIDETTKEYILKINRDTNVPNLETLSIDYDGNPVKMYSDIEMKNEVESINSNTTIYVGISYTANLVNVSAKALQGMLINGTNTWNTSTLVSDLFGQNDSRVQDIKFSVISGNQTKEYTIKVVREENPSANTDVTSISFLKIPAFANDFDAAKNVYGPYNVKFDVNTLNPNVTLADSNANVAFRVNGTVASNPLALVPGKNTVEILITARDGVTQRVIVVEVNRALVSNITAEGITPDEIGFDSLKDAYSFTVKNEVTTFNANIALGEGYSWNFKGGNTLNAGKLNTITAEIKDNNGTVVKTITFDVYREDAPVDNTMWYIIAGVLGGLCLILLIIAIIAFVKGGKGGSKRRGNINDIGIGDYELD